MDKYPDICPFFEFKRIEESLTVGECPILGYEVGCGSVPSMCKVPGGYESALKSMSKEKKGI